jgi:hypothetical protein
MQPDQVKYRQFAKVIFILPYFDQFQFPIVSGDLRQIEHR